MTMDNYNELLKNQDYKCLICNKFAKLVVDHENGKVRGLLCTTCNTGLGKFKDNIELIYKALKYLKGELAEFGLSHQS